MEITIRMDWWQIRSFMVNGSLFTSCIMTMKKAAGLNLYLGGFRRSFWYLVNEKVSANEWNLLVVAETWENVKWEIQSWLS